MDKQRLTGWLRYGANAAFQNADTDMSLDERVRLLIAHEHPSALEIENFRIGWLKQRAKPPERFWTHLAGLSQKGQSS